MSDLGRPRILDDEKRRRICALVGAGFSHEDAARNVGCSVNTVRREALRNPDFKKQLQDSRLHCQLEPLRAMRAASATHWRAAAWMLERTNPRQFARPTAKGYNFDEVRALLDEVIDAACDEISDQQVRDRVCRRLLVAAQYAFDEDSIRRFNRQATLRRPVAPDERAVDELLRELDQSRTDAYHSLKNAARRNPK